MLCATTQIEHDADPVLAGWLCADSATAVHNIKDRQRHVNHRDDCRIGSCNGLDSFYLISVALHKATPGKLLWGWTVMFAALSVAGSHELLLAR